MCARVCAHECFTNRHMPAWHMRKMLVKAQPHGLCRLLSGSSTDTHFAAATKKHQTIADTIKTAFFNGLHRAHTLEIQPEIAQRWNPVRAISKKNSRNTPDHVIRGTVLTDLTARWRQRLALFRLFPLPSPDNQNE